jgi:hypothetical protein
MLIIARHHATNPPRPRRARLAPLRDRYSVPSESATGEYRALALENPDGAASHALDAARTPDWKHLTHAR